MPVIDMAEAKRHMLTIASSQLAEDLVNEVIEVFNGDHVMAISTMWAAVSGLHGVAIAQGAMTQKATEGCIKHNTKMLLEDLPRLVASIREVGGYGE